MENSLPSLAHSPYDDTDPDYTTPGPTDPLDLRRRRHHRHRPRRRRRVLPRVRMRFGWWQLWALVLSLLTAWFLLRALRPWAIHLDDGQPKEPITVLLRPAA